MPSYTYKAKASDGKTVTGVEEAENESALAELLKQKEFLLITAEVLREAGASGKSAEATKKSLLPSFFGGRVSVGEKMIFSRNLAVMLEAGVPITRALGTLSKQSKNRGFQSTISDINLKIIRGSALAEALKDHQETFGELYVNMVAAGEASGNVNEVLGILAEQLRKEHELRSRVRGALVYPAVIVIAMGLIGVLMLIFVVPALKEVFEDLNADLPLTTKVILNSGSLLKSYWWLAVIIFGVAVYLLRLFFKTRSGKALVDFTVLQIPILKGITKKVYAAQFSRTLASLISGGVPILEALRITGNAMGNHFYKESLRAAEEDVRKGKMLHVAFEGYASLYTPLIVQMLEVGGETGQLADVLKKLAEFYEDEVEQVTKNLSSIIEPILMIAIGIIVGFFAISILQPIYDLVGKLQ